MNPEGAGANKPYLAIGLTFLFLGLGFANPWPLVVSPPPGIWVGNISCEVLNLYALITFMGCAHFFYAWQGQWRGSRRMTQTTRLTYWILVVSMLVALVGIRGWTGVAIFSLVVWVYNISHLIKAEVYFASLRHSSNFYSPSIAFTWFTLALFQVGPLRHMYLVFTITLMLASLLLYFGDWRDLATDGSSKLPLLSLFLFGETLLWTAYNPYMSQAFRVGIYVFHIGAASFFHYFSTYFYANRRAGLQWSTSAYGILCVNLAVIGAGCLAARFHIFSWLWFLVAPEWFTLWVALHLLGSDLMPRWKRWTQHLPTGPVPSFQER